MVSGNLSVPATNNSMDELKFEKEWGGISVYKFVPSLTKRYASVYDKDNTPNYMYSLSHKIRMFLTYLLGGYSVFYLYKGTETVGHLVISRGSLQLKMSTKDDIVIGPIWICPKFRNMGYGTKGIQLVLNELNIPYRRAFEFISVTNQASAHLAEKSGLDYLCNARAVGVSRKLVPASDGDFYIYAYTKKRLD